MKAEDTAGYIHTNKKKSSCHEDSSATYPSISICHLGVLHFSVLFSYHLSEEPDNYCAAFASGIPPKEYGREDM